jgi:hypothetical protein
MKKWVISAMQCIPNEGSLKDVVVVIHWRRQATEIVNDKEYFADVYGAYTCPLPEGTFTPYPDLTQEQVEGWLDAGLNVAELDATLDKQIENQVNPPIVQLPLPWSQQPIPVPAGDPQ